MTQASSTQSRANPDGSAQSGQSGSTSGAQPQIKGDAEFAAPGANQGGLKIEYGPAGWVVGNLTSDPKIIYTGKGTLMVKLRVACSDRVKDPATGAWQEGPTQYHDVTCFGKLAENVGEHLVRGNRIIAGGRWQRETWTDVENKDHQRVSLLARDLGPSVAFRAARYIDTMTEETQ